MDILDIIESMWPNNIRLFIFYNNMKVYLYSRIFLRKRASDMYIWAYKWLTCGQHIPILRVILCVFVYYMYLRFDIRKLDTHLGKNKYIDIDINESRFINLFNGEYINSCVNVYLSFR